jgi:hypothetical protein
MFDSWADFSSRRVAAATKFDRAPSPQRPDRRVVANGTVSGVGGLADAGGAGGAGVIGPNFAADGWVKSPSGRPLISFVLGAASRIPADGRKRPPNRSTFGRKPDEKSDHRRSGGGSGGAVEPG